MDTLIGQDIGRYHIIELLGEGGMAIVYRAFDTHLQCDVAVKFLRMERLTPEMAGKTLKRFEREARIVSHLHDTHIVKVTDYGEYQGIPYLVMPYLNGGTLKQFSGEAMPYQRAAGFLAPIARALEYAHKHHILHRDVKPSNILLNEDGQPLLSDFGVAKILSSDPENPEYSLTMTGVGIGTPEYMAPEQGQGHAVDERSDIYSLGIVFYELVTGRKPFIADTPLAVMIKQIHDPLPRPKTYTPSIPRRVEDVIFKALAKEPEDRYQAASQFASSLEKLAAGVEGNKSTKTENINKKKRVQVFDTASITTDTVDETPTPIGTVVVKRNILTGLSNHWKVIGICGFSLVAIVAVIFTVNSLINNNGGISGAMPTSTSLGRISKTSSPIRMMTSPSNTPMVKTFTPTSTYVRILVPTESPTSTYVRILVPTVSSTPTYVRILVPTNTSRPTSTNPPPPTNTPKPPLPTTAPTQPPLPTTAPTQPPLPTAAPSLTNTPKPPPPTNTPKPPPTNTQAPPPTNTPVPQPTNTSRVRPPTPTP